eukprot:1265951-Amphidinium_carterae.2
MVASLSWVSMGRPSGGLKAETLCMEHNLAQLSALRWLCSWVRLQCPPGGRWRISLAHGRGLSGAFASLGATGTYAKENVSTPDQNPELSPPTTEAKWISASTASLPTSSAVVDLQSVLPPELYGLLSVPGMLIKPVTEEEKEVISLPPLFMKVKDWEELCILLVKTGLCVLGEDDWSPLWGGRHLRAGVFGVAKPDTDSLRMIIDRRRKNATEVSVRAALYERVGKLLDKDRLLHLKKHMTLPHALQFGDLLLPKDCVMDMALLDCKDFFYLLRVPEAAMWETPVGRPVSRSIFSSLELPDGVVRCDLRSGGTATLYLRAPAMGDLKSVELAQASHTCVLLRAGMGEHEWMTLNASPPCEGSWRGAYVDDYFQGVIVPGAKHPCRNQRAAMIDICDRKLAHTRQEYARAGFVVKDSKTKVHQTFAVVWGGEINSELRWVSGARDKQQRLLYATHRILTSRRRLIPIKLLERVIGQWVHQLLFQRAAMSLLDDLYVVLHKRRQGKSLVLLSKGAIDELITLVCLWPLFTADLGRPVSRLVTATDATLQRGAAVVGTMEPSEAVWLWHRLPRRPGSISWCQDSNELGVLEAGQPDGMLEDFLNSHALRVVLNYKFAFAQHINIQEAVAVRSMIKWLVRDPLQHGIRLPVLVDNLVVQSVLARGRSCSRALNKCMRSLGAFLLFSNVQILAGWVRSAENPADDPTRGARLRAPRPRSDDLVAELTMTKDVLRYPFEATLDMWFEREWSSSRSTRLFDSTRGYPGEGPRLVWENQRPDLRDTDLRLRVQPATAKRYAQRLKALGTWSHENGFGQLDGLLACSGKDLASILCVYVQYLYGIGAPLQHGLDVLAAVQMSRPEVSLDIRPAWQMQRQWAKLAPVGTRPPMPEQLMLAFAVGAWALGLKRVSAVFVLMFHCLLRPAEAGARQRSQLLLPDDIVRGSLEAAIALPQTKTSDRGARLQSVAIEDQTVIDLLIRVFGSDPPHRSLVAGGPRGLQIFFNQIRDSLGLRGSPWTLATLRGGGAVAYLRQSGGNIVWLQFRGRWESFRSMRHYVQAGLAMQAFASLPAETKERVSYLASLAPILLGPLSESEELTEGLQK